MTRSATEPLPTLPWWRVRMVWLVIAGPLAVVLASFVTLALALRHPDPVLAADTQVDAATTPAIAARNHAAQPRP
ncbi:MAG: nitrogen fixation protein FixH [Rubrivivax sp.]